MSIPAPTLVCPDCGHGRQIHFAHPDEPLWGCYGEGCGCQLGYELTGDLIAGRLRPEANQVLDAMEDEVDRNIALGQPSHMPMADFGDSPMPSDLRDVELADNLLLAAAMAPLFDTPTPALLFRFSASARGGRHKFRDRLFLMPDLESVDRAAQLFADAFALLRRAAAG